MTRNINQAQKAGFMLLKQLEIRFSNAGNRPQPQSLRKAIEIVLARSILKTRLIALLSSFSMHDLRKLVATVGEKLGLGDAVLRRILNHTAPKTDVLHRHYVGLNDADVAGGMVQIQVALTSMMRNDQQGA
jgi:hypothetical protein